MGALSAWIAPNSTHANTRMREVQLRTLVRIGGPSKPSSLARFLPISQYLLELASGVWVLECGVLTSREA